MLLAVDDGTFIFDAAAEDGVDVSVDMPRNFRIAEDNIDVTIDDFVRPYIKIPEDNRLSMVKGARLRFDGSQGRECEQRSDDQQNKASASGHGNERSTIAGTTWAARRPPTRPIPPAASTAVRPTSNAVEAAPSRTVGDNTAAAPSKSHAATR